MKKTVLCTGGSGFLGKNIQEYIKSQDLKNYNFLFPSSKQFNCLDLNSMRNYVENKKIDGIIHLAAKCGGILANKNSPADFLRDNTQMGLNIYELAREYNIKKVYSLGSVCAFPVNCPIPFKESDIWNGPAEITNFPYGQSKRTLLMLSQTYRQQYGIKGAHLIPANMYGECFDKETNIATPTGFKNVKDFNIGDKIYTLNPDTHFVEIEKVVATQIRKSKEFLHFKGSVVDLRVTPEHKIYYKTNTAFQKKKAEYFISRAGKKSGQIIFAKNNELISDIKYNSMIDLSHYIDDRHEVKNGMVRDYKHSSSHWIPLKYNIEDFYEFLGWYISEGSKAGDTPQISISQSKFKNSENCNQIASLLKRMNLPVQSDKERFYFSSRLWCNYIIENIKLYCKYKQVPPELLCAPQHLLEILFSTLMKGDGHKNYSKYTTTSDTLKNQIIIMAMTLGIQVGKVRKEENQWRIPFRWEKASAVKYKNITHEKLAIDEEVYCITTEKNHIVYAGRNNKFSWVGQCDNFDLINSHVIPALINKFDDAKNKNFDKVNLWGTGKVSREFLYAEDCCSAIIQALTMDLDEAEPINLGNGKEIYISDLAELIAKKIGFKGEIVFTGEVSDGQPRRCLDVSRAKKILKWKAKTSLSKALDTTIKYYQSTKI